MTTLTESEQSDLRGMIDDYVSEHFDVQCGDYERSIELTEQYHRAVEILSYDLMFRDDYYNPLTRENMAEAISEYPDDKPWNSNLVHQYSYAYWVEHVCKKAAELVDKERGASNDGFFPSPWKGLHP